MADDNHIAQLLKGPTVWKAWREQNPGRLDLCEADLSNSDLSNVDLSGLDLRGAMLWQADLRGTNFRGTDLSEADLRKANLRGTDFGETALVNANLFRADLRDAQLGIALFDGANLEDANLSGMQLEHGRFNRTNLGGADLRGANLRMASFQGAMLGGVELGGANLRHADFRLANLNRAKLCGADLRGSDLGGASMIQANLTNADLTGCGAYGIAAWDVELEGATQRSICITPRGDPKIWVDNLEVAQFIYLLPKQKKLRDVIDTVTRRGVLILGRFSEGGIETLQAVADWLRQPNNGGYLPLLFDFPPPMSRTYTETVKTLAGLARFVIVDLSGPSVPQEITATVDQYEIPFVPVLERKRKEWSMFKDFLIKDRVLEPVRFEDTRELLDLLNERVVLPAEKMVADRQARLDKIFGRA